MDVGIKFNTVGWAFAYSIRNVVSIYENLPILRFAMTITGLNLTSQDLSLTADHYLNIVFQLSDLTQSWRINFL